MYEYDIGITHSRSGKKGTGDIVIGRDSKNVEFSISASEIDGHFLILGKTGTGKSTLLLRILEQLDAIDCNVVVIDPHGELTPKAVTVCTQKELIFYGRIKSSDNPAGKSVTSNFLKCRNGEDDLERTSEWIRSIFSQDPVISSGTWGPRIQVIFSSVLREYMRQNGESANISGFLRILVTRDRLEEMASSCLDENLRQILEFQTKNWTKWLDYAGSSINKLLSILSNSQIRRLTSSEKDSFDLGLELAKSNRLVVTGISKISNSEETTRVFSLLMLMRIWSEMIRLDKPRDTYIVIDEAQNVPESIMELMLSEGRKFGIHLILSTQFLKSQDEYFEKYLLGNIRGFACFQLSTGDAYKIGNMFTDRLAKRVISVLKDQSYHKFLFWTGGSFASRLPASLSSSPLKLPDSDKLVLERLSASIDKYGALEEEISETRIPKKRSLHSIMVDKFASYLKSQNISMRKERLKGNTISDGYFVFKGREYLVECEVSDLSNKYRVLEKVRNTDGEVLVFLVPENERNRLVEFLANPTAFLDENGIITEKPLRSGNKTLHASDIWSKLEQILIVSYNGREFNVRGKTKYVSFSLGRLTSEWANALFSISTANSVIRKRIYSYMKQKRKFLLPRDSSELASFIGSEIDWKNLVRSQSLTVNCGDLILAL